MQKALILSLLGLMPLPLAADLVVPLRTIRAEAVITAQDVTLRASPDSTGLTYLSEVIGQEAQVVLYPGRPIHPGEIGPPALIQRNQLVQLRFEQNGLQITTEGRALDRGAVGARLRVMNLSSRATLFGQVQPDGSIRVSN